MIDGRTGTGAKPTILVVDDEPLVRMTTADMLRAGGFYVLEASAGLEALDLLAARQPVGCPRDRHAHARHERNGPVTPRPRKPSRHAGRLCVG